ncbi:hypothetical protein WJX73_002684 [Symbiochloris irregularis]|uniref:Dymeclin n=1 Tax=Symbiochloris irregularis TaxID=706552 RepID=A0AAW1P9K7_9CHLO
MNPSQALLHAQRGLLDRACGEASVSQTDPLWDELLNFPTPITKLAPQEFAAAAAPFFEALAVHNSKTHNLQKFLWHICAEGNGHVQPSLLQELVRAVSELLAFGDCGARTYMMHLEAVQLLLVMASTQLYSPLPTGHWGAHPFTDAIMEQTDLVAPLLQRLLQHYIDRLPLPPHAAVYVPPPAARPGVLRLVRSAAATVLWLPFQALTFLVRSGNTELPDSPLGATSQLLALVLLHHAPPVEADLPNPFRTALHALQDADEEGVAAAEGGSGLAEERAHVSYSSLYTALGSSMGDQTVLLMYNLLHSCPHFCNYVFVRGDLDVLMLPLLQQLYVVSARTPSQLYMLLIVILILSQDAVLARNLHQITLPAVPWYKERLLQNISLGSLMVAVLLRTAHRNLGRMKDVYLYTNMLAALTNLAPHLQGLSAYASQRLVHFLDLLLRKYEKVSRKGSDSGGWESTEEEASVYVDFLRLVLEMINTMVAGCLPQNPELVYALLHRQDILAPLQANPRFADLTSNIALAVSFFNERVEASRQVGGWEWSVERVLEVIQDALRSWRSDCLKQFPELHFTYEEESSPEDFFVPYVWTLIITHTTVPWNTQNIVLFAPCSDSDDNADGSQTGLSQRESLADREPSLFKDLPELVLVSILECLDDISLCFLAQTCRYAFSLTCRRHFWRDAEVQEGDHLISGLRNCFAEAARLPPQVFHLEWKRSTRFAVTCSMYRMRRILRTASLEAISTNLAEQLQEVAARARHRRKCKPWAATVPGELIGAVRVDRGQVRLSLVPAAVVASVAQLCPLDWDWPSKRTCSSEAGMRVPWKKAEWRPTHNCCLDSALDPDTLVLCRIACLHLDMAQLLELVRGSAAEVSKHKNAAAALASGNQGFGHVPVGSSSDKLPARDMPAQ